MKPDIRTAWKFSDLEHPSLPIYGALVGSGNLADDSVTTAKLANDSVTPAKLRHDAQFAWGFDGGDLSGLTEWSFGTWVPKVIDGGSL